MSGFQNPTHDMGARLERKQTFQPTKTDKIGAFVGVLNAKCYAGNLVNPIKMATCVNRKWPFPMEAGGIEPPSASDPRKGATYLVYIFVWYESFYRQNISYHSTSLFKPATLAKTITGRYGLSDSQLINTID